MSYSEKENLDHRVQQRIKQETVQFYVDIVMFIALLISIILTIVIVFLYCDRINLHSVKPLLSFSLWEFSLFCCLFVRAKSLAIVIKSLLAPMVVRKMAGKWSNTTMLKVVFVEIGTRKGKMKKVSKIVCRICSSVHGSSVLHTEDAEPICERCSQRIAEFDNNQIMLCKKCWENTFVICGDKNEIL